MSDQPEAGAAARGARRHPEVTAFDAPNFSLLTTLHSSVSKVSPTIMADEENEYISVVQAVKLISITFNGNPKHVSSVRELRQPDRSYTHCNNHFS
jgi:hypothetical protein